jgi:hypothetical protein
MSWCPHSLPLSNYAGTARLRNFHRVLQGVDLLEVSRSGGIDQSAGRYDDISGVDLISGKRMASAAVGPLSRKLNVCRISLAGRVSALADYLSGSLCSFAMRATEVFFLRWYAATGWVGAFLHVCHLNFLHSSTALCQDGIHIEMRIHELTSESWPSPLMIEIPVATKRDRASNFTPERISN